MKSVVEEKMSKYFLDPRLALLIDLSLDKKIPAPTGGWRMLSKLTDDDDIPEMTAELDSSVLSQICLQELGTWGCGLTEFCWSIVCLLYF